MHINDLIKQKSYEHIVYILRRHPITFVPILATFFILFLIPVALFFVGDAIIPAFTSRPAAFPVFILLMSGYYLSMLALFLTQFVDFYLDIWIVTNDRIIDMEQFGLFARTTSELDLFRIQDASTDITGFFATVFNYGNVTVKTASDNKSIVFRNIKNPNAVREDLIKLSHEDRKYHFSVKESRITE